MFYLASIEKPVVPEVASDAYSAVIGRTEYPVTRSMLIFLFFSVGAQLFIQIEFPVFQYYININHQYNVLMVTYRWRDWVK